MSDQPEPLPEAIPAPTRSPSWRRAVRVAFVTLLSLAISFLALLALVATTPLVRETLKPLVSEHQIVSLVAALVVFALVIGVPLILLSRLVRSGALKALPLASLATLVGAAFIYLAWDEPAVRHPLTMEELSPALPGDEATHALFLRYGKGTPAAAAYQKIAPGNPAAARVSATEGDKWAEHLRKNRAEIEAAWAALVDVRAWWDEMAKQPRLGDLTPAAYDAMIPAFQPIRSYTQHACAVAGLKALDGRGDEAMDLVIGVYDVARKMEPTSRTLVRTMIGKVCQRMAIQTATFVLDRAKVSPEKRAAFAHTLGAAAGGPAGARRLVLIEYTFFQPLLAIYATSPVSPMAEEGDSKWMHRLLTRCSRLLINPRATMNFVGDRYYALAACAEERRLQDMEATGAAIDRTRGNYHIKNMGGRMFADMAMPALNKVAKSYWEIEDLRLAMIARLKT